MNLRSLFIVTAVFISLLGNLASAQEMTGLKIMELVEENQRATSDSAFNRMQLSTCRFGIKESRIHGFGPAILKQHRIFQNRSGLLFTLPT